ncbi:LytTR family DNA-binding domain-containing protein [Pseudoprimorskyibacter insulae]|uniref:LytTR family DNA-binding domain-containing protein n=1 Tax=Pseudoprimorskyibacter insulae TaxID=1695997 RepID=UPI001C63985D|nr:LytTR family DNA-binding domain-containing protein [Pseudoprimorskyibacter insulae]
MGERFFYFGAMMSMVFVLREVRDNLLAMGGVAGRLAWPAFILCLSGGITGMNETVFADWSTWVSGTTVLFLVLTISGLVWAAQQIVAAPSDGVEEASIDAAPEPEGAGLVENLLMQRLPEDMRAPVVRLEAQDHRLRVVTEAGTATILMRMSDAEAMMPGPMGLRIHRSHWISVDKVVGTVRRDGRDLVLMADGVEVPVSRNTKDAAIAAGIRFEAANEDPPAARIS